MANTGGVSQEEALADFSHLTIALGTPEGLTKEGFVEIVESFGYDKSKAQIHFDTLLDQCNSALGRETLCPLEVVTMESLKALYATPGYDKASYGTSATQKVVEHMWQVFDKFDSDKNGNLDLNEAEMFVDALCASPEMGLSEGMSGAEVLASIGYAGKQSITFDEFHHAFLRLSKPAAGRGPEDYFPLESELKSVYCTSAAVPALDFVEMLETFICCHPGTDPNSPFVRALADGVAQPARAAIATAVFLRATAAVAKWTATASTAATGPLAQAFAHAAASGVPQCAKNNFLNEWAGKYTRAAGLALEGDMRPNGVPLLQLYERAARIATESYGALASKWGIELEATDGSERFVTTRSRNFTHSKWGIKLEATDGSERFVAELEATFAPDFANADEGGSVGAAALGAIYAAIVLPGRFIAAEVIASENGRRAAGGACLSPVGRAAFEMAALRHESAAGASNGEFDFGDALRAAICVAARSEAGRKGMVAGANRALNARAEFLDRLVEVTVPTSAESSGSHRGTSATELSCDEVTTAVVEPLLIDDLCSADNLNDAHGLALVLGLSRGGYLANQLLHRGAAKRVVGMSVDAKEVNVAKTTHSKAVADGPLAFITCESATQIRAAVRENAGEARLAEGADLDSGVFSSVVLEDGVAGPMSEFELRRIAGDALALLRPGGTFTFSLPHPFRVAFDAGPPAEGLNAVGRVSTRYASLIDAPIADGAGAGNDDKFMTIAAAQQVLEKLGFEVKAAHEAALTPTQIALSPEFGAVAARYGAEVPLAVVFRGTKKFSEEMNHLESFPKKLIWTDAQVRHPENSVIMHMPPGAADELVEVVNRLSNRGVDYESVMFGVDVRAEVDLPELAAFAVLARHRLLDETGACLIKGLDLDRIGERSARGMERLCANAKLAYYIFSSLIGHVDAGARGRLFNVKNAKLDSHEDNVLFSVTDGEAGWHTDGASRDRVYDVVSLISITPGTSGGEFKVANGVNALEKMRVAVPAWILYELFRDLPRDVMENGSGKGKGADLVSLMSRSKDVLRMRILRNGYPIFCERGKHLRFRYMRFWIETGFRKGGLVLPPLLEIAMDMLDRELDAACVFNAVMMPGEMVYSNNMLVAHARNAYKDNGGEEWTWRHKVRAWLQIRAEDQVAKIAPASKTIG